MDNYIYLEPDCFKTLDALLTTAKALANDNLCAVSTHYDFVGIGQTTFVVIPDEKHACDFLKP